MNTPVLLYPTHVEFLNTTLANDIPAGAYYPSIESRTEKFILTRFNPDTLIGPSNHIQNLFNELDNSLPTVDVSYCQFENKQLSNGSIDSRYFPMEEYHNELGKIDNAIESFLASRNFYKRNQLEYKRSILLYGAPGTGKSRYIEHKCVQLIQKHNAVVLRIENYEALRILLDKGLFYIRDHIKDRLKVIVIEELATLVHRNDHTELLNLLDHVSLKEDLLFLMTTNSPEDIPENIVDRPSRVDMIEEIGTDGLKANFKEKWFNFLTGEDIPDTWKRMNFFKQSLSPAYLKELFIATKINNMSIELSWKEIQQRRRKVKERFQASKNIGY